jgi:hypothetical protein
MRSSRADGVAAEQMVAVAARAEESTLDERNKIGGLDEP